MLKSEFKFISAPELGGDLRCSKRNLGQFPQEKCSILLQLEIVE